MLTDAQKADYLRRNGAVCPYCGSPDIEGDSFDHEAGWVRQEMSCHNCDKSWTDVYRLSRVLETEPAPRQH